MPEDLGEGFAFKRVPMKEKSIAELNENDIRVAILGTVVNANGERLILDDGNGSVEVLLPADAKPVAASSTVRVIGRVRSAEGALHIEAEAVQNFSGLDLNLYKSLKRQL